ncbi:hypothetical protein VNI00_005331 [Paramarasmius palmivorus]|uniref:Uncharacterized protein n=1 Tax=Paramarasmius palmivorus TaxID=297713 RepID=A0AAW0DGF5_9AGAR
MLGHTYPYHDAAQRLEQLASDRLSSGYISNPLSQYADNPLDDSVVLTTANMGDGHTWHLTDTPPNGQPAEEIVFTLQGIIMQCDLPPVIRPFVSAKHVQQRLLLTGLNTSTFTNALHGLARVDSMLRQALREESPRAIASTTDGYTTLDLSNRYFTSKRFANEEHHVGFPNDVDPKGVLANLRGEAFVHTTDNVVEYYQRQTNELGQKFKKIQPSLIHKGDIVEVQFTASLVEHAAGKGRHTNVQHITKLVLRSITLLDGSFSEARFSFSFKRSRTNSPFQSIRLADSISSERRAIKRKVGYTEEETREAEDRIKRMAIDRET